jgi:hypothetical protein
MILLQVRRAIGDFGIPIAIMIMVLIDYLINDTFTEVRIKLEKYVIFKNKQHLVCFSQ